MTNLRNVPDHPATVVENLNSVGPRPGAWGDARHQLVAVSYDLRRYEEERDVTFAALDNDTLSAIREVYDREPTLPGGTLVSHTNTIRSELERLYELESLVSELLGLED